MSERNVDIENTPEIINPKSVAIASATWNKGWFPGESDGTADKVRGDETILMARAIQERGYQMIVVDGGSPPEFLEELRKLGVVVQAQKEPGLGAGKREAMIAASKLDGVKVITLTEEKRSLFADNSPEELFAPILRNGADIIIYGRSKAAFETLPKEQRKYESLINSKITSKLIKEGLWLSSQGEIDMAFGPVAFRNDESILELFTRVYKFDAEEGNTLHMQVKPDRWANPQYIPRIQAMYDGLNVVKLEVNYEHSEAQRKIEEGDPNYVTKRLAQYHDVVLSVSHFMANQRVIGNPHSRLSPANS
jgi:hypothetical protein